MSAVSAEMTKNAGVDKSRSNGKELWKMRVWNVVEGVFEGWEPGNRGEYSTNARHGMRARKMRPVGPRRTSPALKLRQPSNSANSAKKIFNSGSLSSI